MKTLRARIRDVVDAAERRLTQPEILAGVAGGGQVNTKVFCVTVAQMLNDKQLDRRKATKAVRAAHPKVRYVYGPGSKPVLDDRDVRAPRKLVGFMEAKRMREARARARRAT